MSKRNIKQKDVKWMSADNSDETKSTYHGYYGARRKHSYLEDYDGNSALCNKRKGISEDAETFIHIEKVEQDGLKRNMVCGSCLRIYDKLNHND